MAHNIEPMDIDNIEGNFDNKENSFHPNNALPRTPCTEKGYEELDVSELNMKLRYSITPASSPMSKSYTAHCLDNRNSEGPENIVTNDNSNLTRSFNSMLTRNDLSKSAKVQPLQIHMADPTLDNNRNTSVLRPLETTVTEDGSNITVTVTTANDIDEHLSIPSSSSSAIHTPEAVTPTKEIPRGDGGSPIMRGLKSVLNMFRASQSPIPPSESEDNIVTRDISSPADVVCDVPSEQQVALASTPITARKQRESSSKRGSPLKESIVFNEDLEKELLWKDETTILFSEEKIPIHKLFFQNSKNIPSTTKEFEKAEVLDDSLNDTVEFMDVSYNDSVIKNKIDTEVPEASKSINIAESDSEFVDCETTFTQHSDDELVIQEGKENRKSVVSNGSELSRTLNKTIEELKITSEEIDRKTSDLYISKEIHAPETNFISEAGITNSQEHDSTIPVELKYPSNQDIIESIDCNIKSDETKVINEEIEIRIKEEKPNKNAEDIEKKINTEINLNKNSDERNESQINEKKTFDFTITVQSPAMTASQITNVTQDIKTEMEKVVPQPLDTSVTVLTENEITNEIIAENKNKLSTENLNEPVDGTIVLLSEDKPLIASTFTSVTNPNDMTQILDATVNVTENKSLSSSVMNNAIQSIEVTSSIDDIKPIDATVSIEAIDKRMSVSNFIMNTTQNITQVPGETLSTTYAFDDKPVSASTFVMNNTQNIDSSAIENVNDDLNTIKEIGGKPVMSSTCIMNTTQNIDTLQKSESMNQTINVSIIEEATTDNNNATQVIETLSTKDDNIFDTPISSSTFVTNTTQSYDTGLVNEKNNVLLDGTVSIDCKDNPESIACSTFIQDNESQMPGETIGADPDSTVLLNSQNNSILSSAYLKNITPDAEKKLLDDTITSKPADFNEVIDQVTTSSDFIKDIEVCAASGCQDDTLSADKSKDDFKDTANNIIDPEVVIDCINALDITLNTSDESKEVMTVNKNELLSENSKSLNVELSVETCQPSALSIQDETQAKTEDIEEKSLTEGELNTESVAIDNKTEDFEKYEKEGAVIDGVVSNKIILEQVKSTELVNTVDADLLEKFENAAKVSDTFLSNTEGQVLRLDETADELKDTQKEVNILPSNIPLPDEDDIEVIPKIALDSIIMNAANSSSLPDVINDLDSFKIQDATQIGDMPIDTIDHVKTTNITRDSLANKDKIESGQIEDSKYITDNIDCIDNQNKKGKFSENIKEDLFKTRNVSEQLELTGSSPIDSVSQCKNDINEQPQLPRLETDLVHQSMSMDISYSIQDIPVKNISDVAPNSNIESDVNNVTSFDPSGINIAKEGSNANPDVKIEAVAVDPVTLSNINNVSVEEMEIDLETSVNASENTKPSQFVLESKNDKKAKEELLREEIIVSENSSPYVLVSVNNNTENKFDSSLEDDFEKIENPFDIKSASATSPRSSSPPITSKGYNFNFDEIDDPFATKTKIRTSPTIDSPTQTPNKEVKKELPKREPINKNKRKSYPVRPKPATGKKNFNSTFDGALPVQCNKVEEPEQKPKDTITENSQPTIANAEDAEINVLEKSELENNTDNISKSSVTQDNVASLTEKPAIASVTTSSSDQSVYLSAQTSGDSITARNVFNLPEIDDMNFNPFASKSKIRQSPPLSLDVSEVKNEPKSDFQNTTSTYSEICKGAVEETMAHNLSNQNHSGQDEKNSSNTSNTTCSSKDGKNTTVREVHTDDDDTIEGPFLETEENEMAGLDNYSEPKTTGFDGFNIQNDMMRFSDLPVQDNEDNELFIDAAAFEFLLNQNKSNVVVDSGKESLFLKFDPLFAKRLSSEGIAAALSKIQKRQSTPKKMSRPSQIANVEQSIAGPSSSKISPQPLNTTLDAVEDLNVTTSKPMMVVTPAVNPIVTPRKQTTPTSSNRRSITFTSPAIAVIDRLLSLSANNSLVDPNTTITQTSREQNEAELALTQLRELLAEKEINVYTLRSESKELKDRLTTLESQMKVLEAEGEERLKKVNELTDKLTEKSNINKSMAAVVEEYERTIASLIAETEQDRKQHNEERARLIAERDEQTAHLASMEVSFSDLHSKYEKSKQIILTCKANEDTYKKSIKTFEENLAKMQTNYETLKQHATSKLNHANQELEKMNRAHESEVLKLNAMIKRKELHITSLEETLTQKTKANEELTAICDELINKVG